jgi:hypothetical protein
MPPDRPTQTFNKEMICAMNYMNWKKTLFLLYSSTTGCIIYRPPPPDMIVKDLNIIFNFLAEKKSM